MKGARHALGLHIKVLLQNPGYIYKLTVQSIKLAFLSARLKALEKTKRRSETT